MGCGCRKSGDRAKRILTAADKEKMRAAASAKVKEIKLKAQQRIGDTELDRRQKCKECPNRFIRHENNVDLEMCGKSNRAIFMLVRDLSFACPVGRFLATK